MSASESSGPLVYELVKKNRCAKGRPYSKYLPDGLFFVLRLIFRYIMAQTLNFNNVLLHVFIDCPVILL